MAENRYDIGARLISPATMGLSYKPYEVSWLMDCKVIAILGFQNITPTSLSFLRVKIQLNVYSLAC